jgi:acetyl esterase
MTAADPTPLPAGLATLVAAGAGRLAPGPFPPPRPHPGQRREEWLAEVALARSRHDACALRASREAPPQPAPPVVATGWARVPVAGGAVAALVYTPQGTGPFGAVVVVHGGAYWMGGGAPGFAMNDTLCRVMCAHANVVVVDVDHRLAPEHPYPAPLEDVYATLAWVHGEAARLRVDPARIAVHGISSGGNLAAAAVQLSLDRGGPPVRAQSLQSPSLDLSTGSRRFTGGPDDDGGRQIVALYRGDGAGDPQTAPFSPGLRADLRGLPRALVVLAAFDDLAADALDYAGRLAAAGVPTTVLEYPMTHTVAEPAVYRSNEDDVVAWLREAVGA